MMTFRCIVKGLRFLLLALIALLLLFCILFAVLQSKWSKEQIKKRIISYLQQFGITATIDHLNGQLPFSWMVKEADLHFPSNDTLQINNVKLRIAILPLLKGKVAINYLKAEHAAFFYLPSEEEPLSIPKNKAWFQSQIAELNLPCQIDVHYFKFSHLDIVNCKTNSKFSFGMSGKAMIRSDIKEFLLDLSLYSPDHKRTYLEAYLEGSELADFIGTSFKVKLDAIPAFLTDRMEGQIAAEFSLEGPWTTWKEVLYDLPRTEEALQGELKGMLSNVHVKNAAALNRDWKFKSEFSILSGQEAYVQKFLLLSNLIHVKGKGTLLSELDKSKAVLAFSFPDLSLIPTPSLLLLKGSAQGKAFYQEGTYKASFQTENLEIDSFAVNTLHGLIKGSEEGREWEGEVKLSSSDADLPLESSFSFEFVPEKLISMMHLNLKISEAAVHGDFSYDLNSHFYSSSLFADIKQLDPFASYFKEENLGGSFSAECHLSTKEEEQNAVCIVSAKSLHFRDYLLDDLIVNADINDLFNRPTGRMNIRAEKVYTSNFYLDRFDFNTQSDEDNWPFYLDTTGRIESSFHLSTQGFWRKENSLFSLELTQLFGDLSGTVFALKFPCEFEWSPRDLSLSPFDFQIGEGHLYSVFECSPLRSFGKWDLKHFPLEILRCFRTRFKLNGFISTTGFFDATSENIVGTMNTILEEVDVLHFGKKKPFRAKGSLQAHLNEKMLQVHTDVHATDEQFLDFTASLPIEYQLYPFRMAFDENKNTSAELTAEGKLQDLFDFVNLGTNHCTGLLSCRLFLSHTLAFPSLQGQLEWQNGTYENYFTGIVLKNVEAKFEAQNDRIRLVQLNANDDKKGEIAAKGKILLKPKEHFPYAFEAELQNLHALGFDMIDCNLTGPLYLNGDSLDMLAQGNLLIDEAKIQMNERLPYEIPTMPFTYINRPSYLYSKTSRLKRGFIFRIDLELTAEKKIFVEGRGLNAELEGNVHLHGTNTNIAANGILKLIKGEYQFSGKVFKLTEGEIVFNDKPVPSAYLNLNGTLTMPDITITAMLHGPLTSPQLTFQSNPQKSTSSILALILFNKDIADISHPEAVQLASTLVSLSGGAGPDVLETIRKSIGVDRLNISSKPGTDEIAIQIGKYLTRGVMITLSQSATSSQVIVEVELPKGFVFQAETQEEEEGKFSLKWRRAY
jgi:autotransporter translocation and assembly factor TamB